MNNLTHLEILKGYKEHLLEISSSSTSASMELEVWLNNVEDYFKKSVFQSEVTNTEIISKINTFLVSYKETRETNQITQRFYELINSAAEIIDKSLKASTPNQTNPIDN